MIFEFSVQKTFEQAIDIVDIGNTVIRCTSRNMDLYYLITKTIFGKVYILKFGPVCPEIDTFVDDFSVNYKKIDYKEATICREIEKFINDYKKDITDAEEVTEFEAWQDFPQIQQMFDNL